MAFMFLFSSGSGQVRFTEEGSHISLSALLRARGSQGSFWKAVVGGREEPVASRESQRYHAEG